MFSAILNVQWGQSSPLSHAPRKNAMTLKKCYDTITTNASGDSGQQVLPILYH